MILLLIVAARNIFGLDSCQNKAGYMASRLPQSRADGQGLTGAFGKQQYGQRIKNINRSPKGNIWSAIPVALLCMIVNLCEGKQGSGPKGDEVLSIIHLSA